MSLAHKADVFLTELDVYGACKLHKSFRSEDAGGLDQLFFFFVNWGQVITGISLILIVILLFVIAARLKNLKRY
jgi:hypothetical protein